MNRKGYIDIGLLFSIIAIFILILFAIFSATLGYQNKQTTTCVVKDKWIKPNDDSSKYLISCDNEVYQITDLFFKGKFNSSDIYSRIKKGKKYKITTTGYRFPFLSWYKNINEYEEVE